MDCKDFERDLELIKRGEFPEDSPIFSYAADSMFEIRRLLSAMKQCCDYQNQKIKILRRLNETLRENSEYKDAVIAKLQMQQGKQRKTSGGK